MQSNFQNIRQQISTGSKKDVNGALFRARQKRTLLTYLCGYVVALFIAWVSSSPDLRQLGLGLMLPGGAGLSSFMSDPSILSALITSGGIGLAGFGFIVWFATGNIFAPPIGWIGGTVWHVVVLPAGSTTTDLWVTPIPLVLIAFGLAVQSYNASRSAKRSECLAGVLSVASTTTEAIAGVGTVDDALSDEDLARLRLLLDRALQPIQNFNGFEKLDQFQTAALRYQINFISYALSMVQAEYMPAFKGYMHEAQDNLIAKQQDRRIWGYWKLENIWGNLRSSGDPIAKDNIMYSGFIAAQLMYRIKSTSYPNDAEAVTLRFEANATTIYQYTLPEIIELLIQQYREAEFGLLPCEPNWIYPLCNAITATAIRAYDAHFATTHWDGISATFKRALETEFTNAKGQLVPFRSSYTGFAPMSLGGAVMHGFPCLFLNPIFPEIAERHWHLTRHHQGEKSWRSVVWPVDVGNYGFSRAAGYAATAAAAKEMADTDATDGLLAHLDQEIPSTTHNGISHRAGASLWAHANEVLARAASGDALRRLVTSPPQEVVPFIKTATYPDVLVAKAIGEPSGLKCVLVPGRGRTVAQIVIAGLDPLIRYSVCGVAGDPYQANSDGEITLTFDLRERLSIEITKAKKER